MDVGLWLYAYLPSGRGSHREFAVIEERVVQSHKLRTAPILGEVQLRVLRLSRYLKADYYPALGQANFPFGLSDLRLRRLRDRSGRFRGQLPSARIPISEVERASCRWTKITTSAESEELDGWLHAVQPDGHKLATQGLERGRDEVDCRDRPIWKSE